MTIRPRFSLLTFVLALGLTGHAAAPAQEHWVGTWAAAPERAINAHSRIGATDSTLREIVHVSLGGSIVRVVFTNEFGTDPLTIDAAHVAVSQGGSSINLVGAAGLTFGGHTEVVIAPGAMAISDPASLKFPAGADLAISLFLPAQSIQQLSLHTYAEQTSYSARGNVVGAKTLDTAAEITSWLFVKGVDVEVGGASAAIVTFGDSITDGYNSTKNANARWPDELALRLRADKRTANLAVLNEGISGNRVLHDFVGTKALARFDRDVLAQSGVQYLILLEGINDISIATNPERPYDVVSAAEIASGLTQLAQRAHARGIKVYAATLTPFVGAGYTTAAGERLRQAVNQWIRTSNQFDAVLDFDKVTQNPANPAMFLPAFDSGDHLHPNDAGYKAMADSIDLKLFTAK